MRDAIRLARWFCRWFLAEPRRAWRVRPAERLRLRWRGFNEDRGFGVRARRGRRPGPLTETVTAGCFPGIQIATVGKRSAEFHREVGTF